AHNWACWGRGEGVRAMFRHTHAVRQVLTREEVGRSLIDEVKSASKTVRGRKRPKLLSPRETLEASAVLRDKRMQLMEQGKKIPDNLKSASERNWQRRLSQLESREPGVVAKAKRMLLETPEKRQFIARNNFCTQVNAVDTGLHPVALHRFWEIVKAAPQGLLRYHVREIVPIIEDRMKESRFQDFFDSSDIEILKRRGYVFEGRDGEPLKLTLEELRLAREADSYRKIDPRGKARMRWLLDRKKDLASKKLAKTPIFRPVVYSEGDALAYLGYRLCPIYAVMMRVFGEIVSRVPRFAPRSMLDFGAGWGTCIFAAVEVWKGIATTQERNTREKFYKKKIEHHGHREGLVHPRLVDDGLRELMKDLLGKEVDSLEKKAAEIKGQVEIGLLPSGCDVEADDAVRERRKLLDDEAIWESCQQWKGKEAREPEGAADDFFGDGMYSGPTREFEETDYFLEKDHGSYPMPGKAEALEKRGVSPQMYLKWFNVREKWAAKYYQHVEKNKMERDPSYRPYSALQYLYGRSETEQPDKALQSEKLHEDDPLEGEDKAIVYRHWDKRIPDLLSRITAVEPSQPMMNYGLDFLTEAAPNVVWQRFLKDGSTATQRNASDLVTCAYTLSELQSEELRADAVRSLWEHCTGLLVIVEAGTPA
ncbi:Methyltransferase-like protein 17, partial [Diplonema papillatum]